ncbi:MAG: uroporphyrinogen decarboxylase family protein [Promethearchaeota archaeon]
MQELESKIFKSPNPLFPDDKMLPRERVLKTIAHEEPDRVPITELSMDSLTIAKYYGGKVLLSFNETLLKITKYIPFWRHIIAKGADSPAIIAKSMKIIIELYRKMGFDIVFIPLALWPTKGHNKTWLKKVFPTPYQYVDEFGRLFEFKTTRYGLIAYYMKGILTSEEVYDSFGPIDPDHPARLYCAEKMLEYTKNKKGIEDILAVPAGTGLVETTWQGMGLTNFSKFIRKNKPFIKRVMRDRADFTIAIVEKIAHLDYPLFLVYDDYGYKQGTFIHPRLWRELVKPELQRIVNKVHEYDMKFILHSCGNINELVQDIVEIGVDVLHPIEPTAYMDIFDLKRKYGNQITLMGNVSPQDLQDKPPEYIRDYVRRLLEELPANGGYIFSSGHSINPAVKLENYLAMRDEFKKHCYYQK